MSHANSTPAKPTAKPERPAGAVLFWHAVGLWAKKIRGKLVYFGRGSYDDALAIYNQQKDDLHAGKLPRANESGPTVYTLTAKFLTAKLEQRNAGELAPRSFAEYGQTCKRLVKMLGRGRLVSDLTPDDFARLRKDMASRWGVVRLKAEVIRSRTPFLWAFKNGLIKSPVLFGESFKVPTAKTLRAAKNAAGVKMFEADEIRAMLAAAGQPLRAMILLGINCGFGNNDVALLPVEALDLAGGWVTFPRPKTAIGRRCRLWPETVEALQDWLAKRPEPKNPDHAGLTFVTYKRGSWCDTGNCRALSHEIRKLLDRLGLNGHRGFYCLRHTFTTIGDETGDFVAVRVLMGHTFDRDITATYRERVSDDRLQKVTDHIRKWLWPRRSR